MRINNTVNFANRHQQFLRQQAGVTLFQQVTTASDKLVEWKRRMLYRRELKRLLRVGPYMIKDVGLVLEEARREVDKPFWTP